MERKAINFDGDVSTEELMNFVKMIPKDSNVTDIVVGGSLWEDKKYYISKDILEIPASLWVLEGMAILNGTCIKVHGDLYCKGVIDAYDFIVKGDFTCEGDASIVIAEVGGDVTFKGNANNNLAEIEIKTLGDFTCYGNCRANVLVGGSFLCEGEFTGNVTKI